MPQPLPSTKKDFPAPLLSTPSYCQIKLKLIKALLSASAYPLITGPSGETPLHLIAPSLIQLAPADSSEPKELRYGRDDKTDYLAEFKDLYQRFVDSGCERNN